MVHSLSIVSGRGNHGLPEPARTIELRMGDVVTVVGPTGSGKTTLINDIELLADGDTPSGRRILLNGTPVDPALRDDPASHPIALITQHTTFLSDLPVGEFLRTHARVRGAATSLVEKTLSFANELTGEPIRPELRMTELSGGQTRALLIADAATICSTPIVLLDEVENAGIDRCRALHLLREQRKIFVFITHDPRIALLSDIRIVMRAGCIMDVLASDPLEQRCAETVERIDDVMAFLRNRLRDGHRVTSQDLEKFL
jgi:ABC-type lipoprotein export system ATPase subunit